MFVHSCLLLLLYIVENERPDIKDLCRYVLPLYAAKWKRIGIFLGVQPGQLEIIKSNNPADTEECCTDLFIKWLEGSEGVTWGKMFEAIDLLSNDNIATITTSK